MRRELFILPILLLAACAPAPAPTASPFPASLVGRWTSPDGGSYEFTESGKILVEGGGITLTGTFDRLSGDRCLEKLDNGSQYIFGCKVEGSTLTIQHEGQAAQIYKKQ